MRNSIIARGIRCGRLSPASHRLRAHTGTAPRSNQSGIHLSDHRFSRSKRLSRGRKASNLTSLAGSSPATCSRTNADSTMGDSSHHSSTREGNSQARSSTIGDNIRRCRRVESCSFGRSCRTEKGRAAVYQSLPHRLGRKVECSAKGLATKESVAFS